MRYLVLCLSFLFCVSAMTPAEASIVVKLTDQQMSQKADRIVHGKVVRKYSKWDSKRRRIYTYIIVAVLTHIKGKTQTQEVTIRQLGGAQGNIGMQVAGTAKFKLGEEIFVFLEKDRFVSKQTMHQVMGMSYGKYQVMLDKKSQERYLVRNLKDISVASWNKKGTFQLKHAGDVATLKKPLKLNTFIKQVQGYIAMPTKAKIVKPQLVKPLAPKVTPVRPTPLKK